MALLTLNDIQTEIFECCWPIGSIFITSKSDDPTLLLKGAGNSSWKKIEGRFLIGANNTYVVQTTGGEATVTLTESQMPSHQHGLYIDDSYSANPNGVSSTSNSWKQVLANRSNTATSIHGNYSGGNAPHNNIPPYYAVNIWERIE